MRLACVENEDWWTEKPSDKGIGPTPFETSKKTKKQLIITFVIVALISFFAPWIIFGILL